MAPSLRDLLSFAANLAAQLPLFLFRSDLGHVSPYEPLSGAPSCPLDGPMSCHNSTPVAGDSCCFVHPGGRLILAQIWDSDVRADGDEEDWSLHGLWPDLCDGTYDQFCRMTPHYTNITDVLRHYGQDELLEFMDRYWLAASSPNQQRAWQDEYNKHGACISTLAPRCYGAAQRAPGLEVVDYFARAAGLFRALDTHTALRRAGVVPHPRRRYPLADVRRALERFGGGRVVLRCRSDVGSGSGGARAGSGEPDETEAGRDQTQGSTNDVLREVWYVFFVRGSFQTGQFVPAQDLGERGDAGNCAPWVRYLPKERMGEL